ncbi:hypothetical protein [Streptomyces qinglanensis]|uniref:Uncharacterized protein n=1 Tax=Streptomyces qinglanensis TaxID=943816 RepID=A0A1H9W1X4_9ACTN|nr:hypothetical protein [Streptomyces qinglanensis]SES27784.1 hypothetical protein SAMN05421870_114172 [Streptomyces qinglanensis]
MGRGRSDLGLQRKPTLSQGERLDEAARALDGMGKSVGGAALFPGMPSWPMNPFDGADFGEYGGQEAFTSFAHRWHEEIEVLAGALRQIHRRIGDGVTLGGNTDHGVRSKLSTISVPDEPKEKQR